MEGETIFPAESYLPCSDLWVITTYYNPAGYTSKRQNYARFAHPILAAGIPLLTVECAFGDEPFELAPSPRVLQVRGRDVLWVKERLINLALARLPPQAEKVAWLDADVLFSNPAWAAQTAALLDRWPVVQPFEQMVRLERDRLEYQGAGRRSFACQLQQRPEGVHLRAGAHGQPGIAWAARRSLLQRCGLYDADITGGNDELFAHALGGGFSSPCVRTITGARQIPWPPPVKRLLKRLAGIPWPRWLGGRYARRAAARLPAPLPQERFFAHYLQWALGLWAEVGGRVAWTPGTVLHLWHGDMPGRQYVKRIAILRRYSFDPAGDLRLNEQGVWQWASAKPGLHQEIGQYFHARREDG